MVPLREFMLEGWGDTQLESHQAVHGGSRIHVQLQFLLVRWLLPRFSHPYSYTLGNLNKNLLLCLVSTVEVESGVIQLSV